MCSGQLSLLPSAGREMSSSLRAMSASSNCSLTWAMDGRIVRCDIISSCQSAATSEIVKRSWSRTHVRSAITSITTFIFYLLVQVMWTSAWLRSVSIGLRSAGITWARRLLAGRLATAATTRCRCEWRRSIRQSASCRWTTTNHCCRSVADFLLRSHFMCWQ